MSEDKCFVDGKFRDFTPELCGDQSGAEDCEIYQGYGFFGGFGLGCYAFCEKCGAMVSFVEDEG